MFLPFQPWKISPSIIRGRSLVLLVLAGFACATILSVASFAQQPSPNVNVLPAFPNGNPSPPFPPPPISLTDALRGDGYEQRQVEAVIAASTRNPDHLLAAFGDYRTVSIPNDTGVGGSAVNAWIGLSRSYNRGRNWFGSMVPCFPQDTAALCASSPLAGLQAGSDATLATTPEGNFYLGALFYTSGGISNIAVVHYRDVPDREGGDNIEYQSAIIVDKGSQDASGNFNDKPAAVGDHARGTTDPGVCGPVYLAYTIFTGGTGTLFTSKLGFSRLKQGKCDSGWDTPQYLNKNFKQNQGAAVAVDAKNGTVYVVWRHVAVAGGDGFPDSILMVSSSDFGASFTAPMPITPPGWAPFDQPSLTTTNFPNNIAFRSNSFPTIAVDGNGKVYVAAQEKTFPTGVGFPPGYYEPRIVIRTSTNGGSTWTTGSIVDSGSPFTSAQQFMPDLSCGGGLCKLMWYDFREQNQLSDNVAGSGLYFVTGLRRQMKTYVAQSPVSTFDSNGNPVFGPSVPVTQYLRDVRTGQIPTVGNVLGGDPAVNYANLPMYVGGTTAFKGDYIKIVTASPFVANPGGPTAFRWATKPTDFIAMSSFGVWTDARDVVFPTSPKGGGTTPFIDDLPGWQTYAPPGTGASCVNAGARNDNVYFSEINAGVIAGSPATSRQLVDSTGSPIERAFPMYIQNPNTDTPGQTPPGKFFRVSFNNLGSPVSGSFDQGTELTKPKTSFDLQILQYSTATVTLYVFCPGCNSSLPFAPFEVTVQQIDGFNGNVIQGGLQTAIFFDSDPTAPFVTNPNLGTNETHNASVRNPLFDNPLLDNPLLDNPLFDNPLFDNPLFDNIAPVNAAPVGDFVYQVTDMGNTASAYTAVVNIAQSHITNKFSYELIIARTYNFPGFSACNSQAIPAGSIISIIPNPLLDNPLFDNPQLDNPLFDNPLFDNATFASVPPPPGSTATASATTSTSASTASSTDDGTTKMPLATDHVYVVLRVYRPSGTTPTVLSPDEQANILANTSLVVFPQAPNTGQGTPVVQPPAPGSSNKVFTSTLLTSSQNPSVFGQSVTFTATVTPKSGTVTPTGFVDFKDGSTLLGTSPVSSTSGVATLQISSLAADPHTITAVYSGDINFVGNISNALTQTVSKASTTTSVISTVNPSVFGQAVTFTATAAPVAPGTGTPTGTVTFADGATTIGSATLSGGMAAFTTSALSIATHSITATYGGDGNFASSTSNTVSQQVVAPPSAASSLSALVSGTNVTSYVPKGSWGSTATGISVVNVEGSSVPPTAISTPNVVNSCASNPVTGQTVCTANNTDVYLLTGTTLNKTMTSSGAGTISFSGGSCTNCGVAMDAAHNKAVIGLSLSGVGAFQFLNLGASPPTFDSPFASKAPVPSCPPCLTSNISEEPLLDPTRNLLLSAAESGNYEIVNLTTSTSPVFYEKGSIGGELDSSGEDYGTGIALAPAEFSSPSSVFIADLTQATFTAGSPGSWTAPSQVQTLSESVLSAGASGVAVAQGTHTGVVTGEFGGNNLTAIALPTTSGSGTPAISDWVTCNIGSFSTGTGTTSFSNGKDPHTVTAYRSPNSGHAIALLANDGATTLAVVDLTKMLDTAFVPRTTGGHGCTSGTPSGTLPPTVVSFIAVP